MARTTIEGGCKLVDAASAVDTNGYGKVTILISGSGAVTAQGGETASVDTDITGKIVDPTTGVAVGSGSLEQGEYVLGYAGDLRYIQVTAPAGTHILLSEPRSTN